MSQENVQRIRAAWQERNRGNREALFDLVAPDGELHPPHGRVTTGPPIYCGPQGWREYANQLDEMLSGLTYEVEGWVEAPGGPIVADMIIRGTGVASGAPFEQRAAHLYEMRGDGRIARMRIFIDRAEAGQAAGLSE
jgi:ketosteroid isomerase-like protein